MSLDTGEAAPRGPHPDAVVTASAVVDLRQPAATLYQPGTGPRVERSSLDCLSFVAGPTSVSVAAADVWRMRTPHVVRICGALVAVDGSKSFGN